jgi:hypothetical protein
MNADAAAPSSNGTGVPATDTAAAQVFISDSRLALTVLNHLRLLVLRRLFGASREQANALTFVLVLTASDASLRTARRVTRARPSPGDATMAGFLTREAALGIAGPTARAVPFAGMLLAGAMFAGIALPELRRAAHGIRAAEHRVRAAEHRLRERRIRVHSAANRAAQARDAAS